MVDHIVCRSSPSMTKSSEAAGQWELFAPPDVQTELTLRSPAIEGSVTSVDTEHYVAEPRQMVAQMNLNPLQVSCPIFADRFDSTERSHSTTSVDTAHFIPRVAEEIESSNSSHGDVQPHKKLQRLNGSRWSTDYTTHGRENLKMVELDPVEENVKFDNRESCSDPAEGLERVQPHGANIEENEAITQAAAALLMLSSSENTCQSSFSSAGDVCRRPFSYSVAQAGEDVSLHGGETSRPAHSEDATASSVLSRPSNKRRYRLISDLLAETPRVSDEDFEPSY